jgi:uncharacterized membrane protein
VRIGDENATISGKHVYEISYTLRGALSQPKQLPPELYMNVNGTGWEVSARVVRATLKGEAGMFSGERSCYKGVLGSGSSCTIRTNEDGSVTFEATNLAPRETVTFAQAFRDGSVVAKRAERVRTGFLLIVVAVLTPILWLGALARYVYRYRTEYRTDATVIVQYEPYNDLLPLYTGVLMDGRLDPRDISAGIVYLAEQGYLKIEKIDRKVFFSFEVTDYRISLIKNSNESRRYNKLLLLLFPEIIVGAEVTLSDLKENYSKQRKNSKIIRGLQNALQGDLVQDGFREESKRDFNRVLWIVLLPTSIYALLCVAIFGAVEVAIPIVFVSIFVHSFAFILLGRRMTRKGYDAQNHLEGFLLFLSVTEQERYKFHNAPEKSPEQFMEFLPYAIAFGVETGWAKVFEGVTIPSPDWYDGGQTSSTFSPLELSSSLSSFSSALATSTISHSSHSSASSGGGSAGGGGGGGGGGSW